MPPINFGLFSNRNNNNGNYNNNNNNGRQNRFGFNNNQYNQNMNYNQNMQQGQGYPMYGNQNPRNMGRNQMPANNRQNMNGPMNQMMPQNQQMMPNANMNQRPMNQGMMNPNQGFNQMPQQQMPQGMPQQQMPQGMPQQMPQGMPQQGMPQGMPDLSNLPVFEPLAGEVPMAQNPMPQQPQGPVSYEQPDEKTMEEIRRIIAEKRGTEVPPADALTQQNMSIPALPEQSQSLAVPAVVNEPDEKLREFIQNERNASEFYKYLSDIAAKDEYAQVLRNISGESEKRSQELNDLYQKMYGRNYDIKKTKINNSVKFKDGLSWAINVENKSLREISDYYGKMNSDTHSRKVNAMIHKKLCDLNYLQTLYTNMKAFF